MAVDFHLPQSKLTNADLARLSDQWTDEKIFEKTGVRERRIAGLDEFGSDLAYEATQKLFARGDCQAADVDFLLYVTQSPEQFLPATACILQSRLGLPLACGAIDINQGCSGYVYGLGVATGLIESGQARNVLLLCGDTPSRFLASDDMAVRTLFGDGGSASWITATDDSATAIGPFIHGTDGRGAPNLCVRGGGLRATPEQTSQPPRMLMNGPEVFAFTMTAVPKAIHALLAKAGQSITDVDLYVFHQANCFVLDHLRNKLKISKERFLLAMENCGNTTSSSIPIALRIAEQDGRIRPGMRIVVVGFGVGYSWSLAMLTW